MPTFEAWLQRMFDEAVPPSTRLGGHSNALAMQPRTAVVSVGCSAQGCRQRVRVVVNGDDLCAECSKHEVPDVYRDAVGGIKMSEAFARAVLHKAADHDENLWHGRHDDPVRFSPPTLALAAALGVDLSQA